jgi:hypothetical protein
LWKNFYMPHLHCSMVLHCSVVSSSIWLCTRNTREAALAHTPHSVAI